jgi:hypothetical protein
MSRTTRKTITERNHREARKGHKGWWSDLQIPSYNRFRGRRAGAPSGLTMSSRSSRQWGDDFYTKRPQHRRAERRTIKRRERREAMKEATR